MTQTPPAAPPDKGAPLDPVTARIVLCLDDANTAFRAGGKTGIQALELTGDTARVTGDDEFRPDLLHKGWKSRVRAKPDHIELAILTALADTYGSEMLTNTSLGYAVRLVARHGGVTLLQRVLWGESASDVQLATMLGAARAAFMQIAFSFSDELLSEANDALSGFRLRPPGEPDPKLKPERGDRG